ncbi:MAG: hypothetical protein SH850_13375 [Planctomycetaceae bacterium]|nr:hypothetical protein [Planctomycetaceae bacterium]
MPNHDFTLCSALYYDSIIYYEQARIHEESGDQNAAERYMRSSLLAAFSFFEAQINQIAFANAQAHGGVLGQIEKDVLEEMETLVDDRGNIVRKAKFYRTEARFSLLAYFLSGQEFDRGGEVWQRFCESRELRDTWTHPKPPFDTWSLTLENVRTAIVSVHAVLGRLSEMMDCRMPLWCRPIDDVLNDIRVQSSP